MTAEVVPMIAGLGTQEIILILLVVVLLFGAKKLPELARGSGRALRIFKAETKGLLDDEDESKKTEEQRQIDAQRSTLPATPVEETTQSHGTVEERHRPDTSR
jgi:sec-independent protein translocase protein TatA